MVNFEVSANESRFISLVAERYMTIRGLEAKFRIDVEMDITAVHNNGCPLNLVKLLNAKPFDFVHDIDGIRNHINRKTGKLYDHFNPRYAVKQ